MLYVENSGDATLVLPPFSLDAGDMARLRIIAEKVAAAFEISGPFNMQVIRKPADTESGETQAELKVIETQIAGSGLYG
jgi:carbamoyl-phosphate synthase large subunit